MKKIQYIHGSMWGTYLVDCDVISKISDNLYTIKFKDDYTNSENVRTVKVDELVFPSFADLIM